MSTYEITFRTLTKRLIQASSAQGAAVLARLQIPHGSELMSVYREDLIPKPEPPNRGPGGRGKPPRGPTPGTPTLSKPAHGGYPGTVRAA